MEKNEINYLLGCGLVLALLGMLYTYHEFNIWKYEKRIEGIIKSLKMLKVEIKTKMIEIETTDKTLKKEEKEKLLKSLIEKTIEKLEFIIELQENLIPSKKDSINLKEKISKKEKENSKEEASKEKKFLKKEKINKKKLTQEENSITEIIEFLFNKIYIVIILLIILGIILGPIVGG